MPSIAVVGAGPQLGLAIARTFGAEGFDVALVARNRSTLDDMVATLESEDITAAAFTTDVLDRPSLTEAISRAAERFGGIDALEYSPAGTMETTPMTSPSHTSPEDIQLQIEFQLYGAIAATAAVLPAIRAAGAGTLLFTTGAGSIEPVTMLGNVNSAAAALRNWAINLHHELADTGVYAAHLAIGVSIEVPMMPGSPTVPAADIAGAYWDLHTQRTDAEHVVTL